MSYVYVLTTILLTVYGQIIVKWRVGVVGQLPADLTSRIEFLGRLLLNPWILSAFFAAFLAAVSWMAAMTKLQLSHAYPFTALSFVMVIGLSAVFFDEPLTVAKVGGLALIVVGIVVGSTA